MELSAAIKNWILRNKNKFKNQAEESEISRFLFENYNYKNSINFSYEQCLQKIEKSKNLNKKGESQNTGSVNKVLDLSNGFYVVNLLDKESKQWEADQMRNCLAGENYLYHENIFSIRNNLGEPFCSIETKNNEITQIQGKFNSLVPTNLIPYVIETLESDFFKQFEIRYSLHQIGYTFLGHHFNPDDAKAMFKNIKIINFKNNNYYYNRELLDLTEDSKKTINQIIKKILKYEEKTKNQIKEEIKINPPLENKGLLDDEEFSEEFLNILKNLKLPETNENNNLVKTPIEIKKTEEELIIEDKKKLLNIMEFCSAGTSYDVFEILFKNNLFEFPSKIRSFNFQYPSNYELLLNFKTKKTLKIIKQLVLKKQVQDHHEISSICKSLSKQESIHELIDFIEFYFSSQKKISTFLISSLIMESKSKRLRKLLSEFILKNNHKIFIHEQDYFYEKILSENTPSSFENNLNIYKINYHPLMAFKYAVIFGNLPLVKHLVSKHNIDSDLQKRTFYKILSSYDDKLNSLTFKNKVFDFLIKNSPDFLLYENSGIYIELKKELKYKNSKKLELKIDEIYKKQVKRMINPLIFKNKTSEEIIEYLCSNFTISKKDFNFRN